MSKNLVSIIMPAYNCESTIRESIKSVLNQTYSNFELVITNDNSTDNTKYIIEEFSKKDKRIKVYLNGYLPGAANARNNSIKKATGSIISFLDSDDVWLENKLQKQISVMISDDKNVVHSSYNRMNDKGNILSTVISKDKVTYNDMLKNNYIGNLTGMYNCLHLGKFYQKNIGHEDYDMWLRILSKTDSVGINDVLACYRVSKLSLSSNKIQAAKWHFNILRERVSLIKSVYYLSNYIISSFVFRIFERK
ncbi:glycosyltransferase family 2 protein [Photobacterium andalusiense]|uniref:UDP-Glc:alpha-D-GlcNAc-diphosphoundecaprenol beta-1,3-glucosyltransferase WfgD n=1 Tax=Photobacterium andalusiense TaxID=2204296 RepID=A0A1Y6MHP7_9GAMM|nr:glycosyltransferase family 2 protein [Photobacterium andalusiense]SMY35972.1 UDP-Glc:alpha-D-GlcNAc-diphosphoundecaprenol beta-1,3-glucosyltransferase WfgD [Photobacterium andalusiense]